MTEEEREEILDVISWLRASARSLRHLGRWLDAEELENILENLELYAND